MLLKFLCTLNQFTIDFSIFASSNEEDVLASVSLAAVSGNGGDWSP